MHATKRIAAVFGALALTSTLAACGGVPKEVDADQPDQSNGNDAGGSADEQISIASINADNVAGTCKQALGEIADVYETLAVDVPSDATFGSTDDRYVEGGGWRDEYFPEDLLNEDEPGDATIRCQAPASYEDDSGKEIDVRLNISITANEEGPRGNTDFTVNADGMTAGIDSSSSSGSGMQEKTKDKLVDQSKGEQYLTDDVLPKFKP
ncbi:hypothetical protein BI49514_02340 [Brevibacterium iodinum ATCC 49514]|uniref:Lipoprotein n=1 Tax=Brevibacterium iodinum ATCC 49514 TaxID=1255616 RepID=A0A2H1JTP4_9MICO|nr:hypothetical protein [Brevibacterium iodinum]SMX90821.1 hypothetical protein BI49514_02340 [Brevibacterium iodinum ATCC 49514]SUW12417.1 Uncharacterised protein [Brevibacterium iodinum]